MPQREVLEAQIRNCTQCELHMVGLGPVPWRGVRSDIMVLGEAPGRSEDEEGIPFCGPAGQLLWRELEQVGISSHTVFTANAVCCWPDGTPTDQQITACQVNLFDQFHYCEPIWILALGRIANRALRPLSLDSISQIHGQWYEAHGTQVFPTYHPSYILRNQTVTRSWRRDLENFARVTQGYGYDEEA